LQLKMFGMSFETQCTNYNNSIATNYYATTATPTDTSCEPTERS